MTVTPLRADDERFHGTVMGRELLELLKMLHRICASGVLHLDAERNRGSICLDGGVLRAAFFNGSTSQGFPARSRSRIEALGKTATSRYVVG